MLLNEKILSGSIWSLIGNAAYQLSGLIIFIILSRILTPVDFGTAALAIIFVELTNVLVRFGLVEVVARNIKAQSDKIENDVFLVTLFLGFITSILLISFSSHLEVFFDAPGLGGSLQILSIVPLMQGLTTAPEGILRKEFKFKALAIRLLSASILAGGIAIFLAYQGYGFYSLIIQKIISASILLILVWGGVEWRPNLTVSNINIVGILKQGFPIVSSSLIGQSIFKFIELIIGFFLGVAVLGQFKIASKLLGAIVQFTIKPIVDVSFSAFASLKNEQIKLESCYLKFITICTLFSFPAFLGALVIGPDMVSVIFGEQWGQSGVIFSILCLGGVSSSLNYFFSQLCHATHHSHILFRVRIIELITVLILVSICAQFSIYHVAYCNVMVASLLSLIMLVMLKRVFLFSITRIIKSLFPSFLSAVVMFVIIFFCLQASLSRFDIVARVMLTIGIGIVIYSLFYRIFFPNKVSGIISNIRKIRQ